MEKHASGFTLLHLVSLVEKEKGKPGIELLTQKCGSLNFYSFQKYPIEIEIKMHQEICTLLFGNTSEESHYQLGTKIFQSYLNSIIGKTIMSLLNKDIKSALLGLPQALTIFQKDAGYEFYSEDCGDNHIRGIMKGNPLNIGFLAGMYGAGISCYHCKPNISWQTKGPQDYEFDIKWEPITPESK